MKANSGGTIAEYIRRFREAKPTAPEERVKQEKEAKAAFWWLSPEERRTIHGSNSQNESLKDDDEISFHGSHGPSNHEEEEEEEEEESVVHRFSAQELVERSLKAINEGKNTFQSDRYAKRHPKHRIPTDDQFVEEESLESAKPMLSQRAKKTHLPTCDFNVAMSTSIPPPPPPPLTESSDSEEEFFEEEDEESMMEEHLSPMRQHDNYESEVSTTEISEESSLSSNAKPRIGLDIKNHQETSFSRSPLRNNGSPSTVAHTLPVVETPRLVDAAEDRLHALLRELYEDDLLNLSQQQGSSREESRIQDISSQEDPSLLSASATQLPGSREVKPVDSHVVVKETSAIDDRSVDLSDTVRSEDLDAYTQQLLSRCESILDAYRKPDELPNASGGQKQTHDIIVQSNLILKNSNDELSLPNRRTLSSSPTQSTNLRKTGESSRLSPISTTSTGGYVTTKDRHSSEALETENSIKGSHDSTSVFVSDRLRAIRDLYGSLDSQNSVDEDDSIPSIPGVNNEVLTESSDSDNESRFLFPSQHSKTVKNQSQAPLKSSSLGSPPLSTTNPSLSYSLHDDVDNAPFYLSPASSIASSSLYAESAMSPPSLPVPTHVLPVHNVTSHDVNVPVHPPLPAAMKTRPISSESIPLQQSDVIEFLDDEVVLQLWRRLCTVRKQINVIKTRPSVM